MTDTLRHPPELLFTAAFDASAPDATPGALRRFSGTAYSGEVIHSHWAWGDVAFDLDTLRVPERLPVLIEHDRAQRAGVIDRFAVSHTDGLTVHGYLLDTPSGRSIAAEADAGFPWQMSVHIDPGKVEECVDSPVNGRAPRRPLTVFRDGTIREVSFTPTGADARTHAIVFTHKKDPHAMDPTKDQSADLPKHDAIDMAALNAELAQIKAENERLQAQFAARTTADRVARFAALTGKTPDDTVAATLAGMSDEQFALVACTLAERPAVPEHLFHAAPHDSADTTKSMADFVRQQFQGGKR